ncbi:Mitochondrial distribution and morphology protein 12 [Rhizina undulata]
MSIDLNWDALTTGPDAEVFAERIRSFIDDKFQLVPFPKFIKSVKVHSFSFGSIPPNIEIKSFCDPYPEFYEEDLSDSDSEDGRSEDLDGAYLLKLERERRRRERRNYEANSTASQPPPYSPEATPMAPSGSRSGLAGLRSGFSPAIPDSFPARVGVTGVATPLFNPLSSSGSSSNLHYFHSALSGGFNGTHTPTPLSAFQQNIPPPLQNTNTNTTSSGSIPSPPSTADSSSGPPPQTLSGMPATPKLPQEGMDEAPSTPFSEDSRRRPTTPLPRLREPRDEDTQIIARVQYSGNVRLELTAELLLEYPITNFVALPVRLVVTGCTFDGLACIAYIRRRAHFCFLDEDPEAETRSGVGSRRNSSASLNMSRDGPTGRSLLKEVKVESEIGEKGKGKQVLKNVGKVERFVLEQVRRIFEEEFVFPSTWTFLI